MRKIVLAFIMAFFIMSLNAQDELPTAKGNKLFNVGVGMFGSTNPSFMPLHAGMDFFIINNLSLGFDVNWKYYYSKLEKDRHQLLSAQAVM